MAGKVRVCTFIPELTEEMQVEASLQAILENPVNAPRGVHPPGRIAVLSQKYWGQRVKDLTIGFMEPTSVEMRNKVLLYANRWGDFSLARFRWTQTDPIIRISFGRGGYYSYLGTDCLSIPRNQHTMNLEGLTVRTRDDEWERIVLHEFGHGLGCPHEHARKKIQDRLDYNKVVREFMRTQGWSEAEVRQQIFPTMSETSLMGASPEDEESLMCYQFSGRLTKDGTPILGGNTFSKWDKEFFAKVYPKGDVLPILDKLNAEQALEAIRSILAKVE